MVWLQTPQWGRWAIAALIAIVAVWVELRPPSSEDHPFATRSIVVGEIVDHTNTATRPVPHDTFPAVTLGAAATRPIGQGMPILPDDLRLSNDAIPPGWWVVAAEMPRGAAFGEQVRIVLVDTGQVVEGIVAGAAENDPFGGTTGGSVAVPGEHAAAVAAAAAIGQIAVLISSG